MLEVPVYSWSMQSCTRMSENPADAIAGASALGNQVRIGIRIIRRLVVSSAFIEAVVRWTKLPTPLRGVRMRESWATSNPAIWADMQRAGQLTDLWRRTSKTSFEAACTQLRIGPYDGCPCRSGEKRRFCCEQS